MRVLYPWFIALLALAPLLLVWLRHNRRQLTPLRRRLLSGLRLLALLLLVGAVARLAVTQPYERVNAVFALDVSHSVSPAARQQALDFIRTVGGAKRAQDGAGLVVFGADAYLEQGVARRFTLPDIASEVDGSATNLARALQVSATGFPAQGAKRLVLLSDGNENVASAAEAVLIARSLGVSVFPVPLGRGRQEPEVRVENLIAPRQVRMGTPYHVEAVVFSSMEAPATLELFREGSFVERQEVVLRPGKNRHRFAEQAGNEGMQLYQVVVNSAHDTMTENNHWQAFTEVRGRPKVLRLYDPPDREAPLVQALVQQGLDVHSLPWQDLPHMLGDYLEYAALVFDNVPGFGISVSQMEVLERYVRDMGGGVLMLGGEKSFGAGGYYRTPLEKILPVDMDVPTKVSIPSLAMVMVIDRSDSMGSSVSGAPSSGFGDR
ncbi:MAG: VWA domain-containing protein, partial [Candidatus Tectomicrobia bacterium]|nr:VWA domain-containing protein [Candidatus Tectomicrobia bacterium]